MIEFIEFLDDDNYLFAAAGARKCQLDEFFIFETIKDQQAVGRLFQGHGGIKFCLRAGLKAKVVTRSLAQVLLHD